MDEYLEEIKQSYHEMKELGMDMTKPKKWIFYFYSDILEDLGAVSELLVSHGYVIEFMGKSEEEEAEEGENLLVVSLVKAHKNPQSFFDFEENLEFLIANPSVEYDGWEVEDLEEEENLPSSK